jgi:sugar/nucleoside kinase (ribokinase family)
LNLNNAFPSDGEPIPTGTVSRSAVSAASESPAVIVYGTICLDRFIAVDAHGEPLSETGHELPGGEAFNTATALAGWDIPVLLTGTAIGSDAESERLRDLLDNSPLGLPRTFIPDDPHAVTPVCTVRVFPDGERTMSGRGFQQAAAPPPLPDQLLTNCPIYATCPNLGTAAVEACLRAANAGCPIIAMDMEHLPEIVRVSRILVTSQETLRKRGVTDSPETIARRLVETGAQTAIVTLGANGSITADRDSEIFHTPSYPVASIVDTTGAGDTFRAGLCFGLLHGLPIRGVVRFATAAAALHCQVLGGGSRIPLEKITALAKIF